MPVLVTFSLALAALIAGVTVGIAINRAAFERRVDTEVAALFAELEGSTGELEAHELEGLPAPVRRFVLRNQAIGSPRVSCARTRLAGAIRLAPDQAWSEFEAEHYVLASTPARLWYGRVRPYPLWWFDLRELLLPGLAQITTRTLSSRTTDRRDDQQVHRALLLRWLCDLVAVPSAALEREEGALRWRAIDERRAEAVVESGPLRVRGEFSFDPSGDVVGFETRDHPWIGAGRFSHVVWQVEFSGHRDFSGLHVPTRVAVRWELDGQTFPCLSAELEIFESDVPRRFGSGAPAGRAPNPSED